MDKIKVLKIIRELSLFIFVLAAIFPEMSSKAMAIPSIIIWLLMNLIINKRKFFDFFIKPNFFIYSVYFWILSNVIYIIVGYSPELRLYITNYIRIAITSIIYLYYIKNDEKRSMKTIVIYTLIIITIVNIITIIANIRYYNISRILSTTIKWGINTFGVGSYFHIYGLIYPILILSAYMIKNIKKIRENNYIITIGIILCIAISLYTIFITEFFIAILLLILGLFLIMLKIDNIKELTKYLIISLSCIIILMPLLKLTFKTIAENTESHNLKIRAQDLYILFSSGSIEETVDFKARVEVYTKSIKAFINNPLLGTEWSKESSNSIGKHSTFLDQLGKYGLIGSLPFFLFLNALYRETYKTFNSKWTKRMYLNCLIIFTLFMIINTSLFVSIFYMMFVMSPMMLKVFDKEKISIENK